MKLIKQIKSILLLNLLLLELPCFCLFSKDLILFVFKGIMPTNLTIGMALLISCVMFFRYSVDDIKEIYKWK